MNLSPVDDDTGEHPVTDPDVSESDDRPRSLAPPPTPIGTKKEGAIDYLGCSRTKFEELLKRKIVKALSRGWYAYQDLDDAIQTLRMERDHSGPAQTTRHPKYTKMSTPKEFLR